MIPLRREFDAEAFSHRVRESLGAPPVHARVEHLAHASGLSPRTVWRWLRGDVKAGPSVKDCESFATAAGVEPEWLAWGRGAR